MLHIIVISIVILVLIGAVVGVFLTMSRQKAAVQDEVERLKMRLEEMEMKLEAQHAGSSTKPQTTNHTTKTKKTDVTLMNNTELYNYMSQVIRKEELFRWPDFNRAAAMEHFSLSAARVGAAFAQGGGQTLPEFVRNCRLDYASRLIVEKPELSYVKIGKAAGYQHTTTFYHDFKARYGMTPAEYRMRGTTEKVQMRRAKDETRIRPS